MKLSDLNKDQKSILKGNILAEKSENVSYGELIEADTLVSDDELEERFGGTNFVTEDFMNY